MPATSVWLARIEAAMNRTIADSSAAATAAARLEGTTLEIAIEGITRVRAAVFAGRLALTHAVAPDSHGGVPPDAAISGPPLTLLRAMLERGAPHAGSGLNVSGDAELAAAYRTLFRVGLPDAEEQIARLLGDAPGRAVGRLVSNAVSYLQRTRRTVEQNIAEYLQEESRDLVSRTEADEFLQGVDQVRETADRVAARLQLLEQRLKGTA